MSGQIYIESVRTESLPDIWETLRQSGFELADDDNCDCHDAAMWCRQDDRKLRIGVDRETHDPEETFLVLGYPPYSIRPWRWIGDQRFFDNVTTVLDEFHFRD